MRKHIKLFENFEESELKELKASPDTRWNNIRDCVQSLKPFTIINFKDNVGCSKYLEKCNNEFIKQDYYRSVDGKEERCPSIFMEGNHKINDEDFKKYRIIDCLIGKEDDPNITVKTKDDSETIGNEVVSTLSQDEVYPDNHYKTGSVFYKFINFFS